MTFIPLSVISYVDPIEQPIGTFFKTPVAAFVRTRFNGEECAVRLDNFELYSADDLYHYQCLGLLDASHIEIDLGSAAPGEHSDAPRGCLIVKGDELKIRAVGTRNIGVSALLGSVAPSAQPVIFHRWRIVKFHDDKEIILFEVDVRRLSE